MTPHRLSSPKKICQQALLGLSILAISNASLAATALVKVNISLPQILTTSLSRDSIANPSFDHSAIQSQFRDSKNNGHLVRADDSENTGHPVTYLYIQT